MSEKSIIDQIKHYQRDIDKCPQNSDRMIRCIQRLCVLPVTVQHLQDTGIGRSVNSLRKYGGEAADAAKALVAKWKAMVAAEESSDVEDSHDEPSPEKLRDSLSSPDQNQKPVLNSDNKTNPHESNSLVLNKSSSLSRKSSNVDNSNSSHTKSSHQSVSEHRSSSKHRSHDRHNSVSSDKYKHKDKRSNTDKSNSENPKHRSSLENISQSEKNSSQRTSKNNYKSESKSHNKDKSDDKKNRINDHKNKRSSHSTVTEKEHRHSREQSKSSYSPSVERKRPLYEISDNESSSLVKRKRKKSNDSTSHSKKSSMIKEESCDEDMENSSGSENEESSSSRSDEDVSRHSSERSETEDESNDNSDNSCALSNDGSSICSSNNHVNGHSSQTSDTEKETDSSSSTISNQRHSHKKAHSRHHSQKSRSQSDYRKSNKNSGQEKYVKDKIKEEHKKKSSHYKELPIKIKQEKVEEPVIKKEKDVKAEDKGVSDKISKENNVKSSSVKNSKPSSKHEEKNTIKESRGKLIKIEKAADGSIDCESGASFADALLGVSGGLKKSQKKKSTPISTNKTVSSSTTSSVPSIPRLINSDSDSPNEPLLLKKNIKLEPLEVDLAATLPEITPNYRPLPHYSPPSSPAIKRSKLMSEEEALSSIMSTKNQRTKVFSGNKISGMCTVPTLFEFCIQVLRENIDALEYTGGVPYEVLKPVLDRATADQLYQLEHYNPYLIEDTDPLWAFHCNKDFRNKKRADLESWRDLYLRCLDEREQKLKALTANITQSMAKSTPVRQTKLAYVDSIVKPPRNIARKQAKFGTANSNKHDIVSKAVVGAHSSTSGQPLARDVVPAPHKSSSTSAMAFSQNNILKKKKAPLMAKALQLIKGNRFKR